MSHILVTGATGFIGPHLVRKLVALKKEQGWEEEIVCLVRTTSDISHLKGLDIKLMIGDLREPETLVPAVKGATFIYHLGAETYTISRKRFWDSIVVGTENLLKAVVQHGDGKLKRFLYVSSQAGAGPSKDKTPSTEETPPASPPVSWYAEAKLKAEQIAKTYMDRIPITIVRPSSVYGEGDPASKNFFLAGNMRIHILSGFKKRYTGMVYAPDLVEGFTAAVQHPKTIGETYFLCNPQNYPVLEMMKTVGKAVGKPFGIPLPIPLFFFRLVAMVMELLYLFTRQKPIPSRDKVRDVSQVYWLCTAAKAKKDFGWEAKHSLLDGLKNTWNYFKEEDRTLKKMPLESKGVLWLKYFFFSLFLGIIIEALAAFGNIYLFTPWWVSIIVVVVLWGLIFGSLAMVTRTCHVVIQYIPGFLLLVGGELLNHFYLHLWRFGNDSLFGITNPVMRAVVLGIVTGFLIPIINAFMRQFYQRKLRLGVL
jgi:dihydroflavonol-4-reductase